MLDAFELLNTFKQIQGRFWRLVFLGDDICVIARVLSRKLVYDELKAIDLRGRESEFNSTCLQACPTSNTKTYPIFCVPLHPEVVLFSCYGRDIHVALVRVIVHLKGFHWPEMLRFLMPKAHIVLACLVYQTQSDLHFKLVSDKVGEHLEYGTFGKADAQTDIMSQFVLGTRGGSTKHRQLMLFCFTQNVMECVLDLGQKLCRGVQVVLLTKKVHAILQQQSAGKFNEVVNKRYLALAPKIKKIDKEIDQGNADAVKLLLTHLKESPDGLRMMKDLLVKMRDQIQPVKAIPSA